MAWDFLDIHLPASLRERSQRTCGLKNDGYSQAFTLNDITAMPDDEIMTHRRVAVLELIQKHIRTRDMLKVSNDIAQLLNQWALPHEQFRSMLFYIRHSILSYELINKILTQQQNDGYLFCVELIKSKRFTINNVCVSLDIFIYNKLIK